MDDRGRVQQANNKLNYYVLFLFASYTDEWDYI